MEEKSVKNPQSVFEIPNEKEADVLIYATIGSMAFIFVMSIYQTWNIITHPSLTVEFIDTCWYIAGSTLGIGGSCGFIIMTIHRLWEIQKSL